MPLIPEQEQRENETSIELMSVQIKLLKTQYDLEPWELLAIGLGTGAG